MSLLPPDHPKYGLLRQMVSILLAIVMILSLLFLLYFVPMLLRGAIATPQGYYVLIAGLVVCFGSLLVRRTVFGKGPMQW